VDYDSAALYERVRAIRARRQREADSQSHDERVEEYRRDERLAFIFHALMACTPHNVHNRDWQGWDKHRQFGRKSVDTTLYFGRMRGSGTGHWLPDPIEVAVRPSERASNGPREVKLGVTLADTMSEAQRLGIGSIHTD
jgi:hypothetical protein